MAEDLTGAFGTTVRDHGGSTYESLRSRADVDVSPFPGGAGGRKEVMKPLEFRAFDVLPASEGGGMRSVVPRGPGNPAPLLEPPAGAQPVLQVPQSVEQADTGEVAQTAQIMKVAPTQNAPAGSAIPTSPAMVPTITGSVIFVTPMGDFDFGYYSLVTTGQWLTLLGPKFPNLTPDSTLDLKIDGQIVNCYAPGILVEIQLGSIRAFVTHFLKTKES